MSTSDPVNIEQSDAHIRVFANGVCVADSRRALTVLERGHKPVLYLPPEDVHREFFQQTSHSTHCPYKGKATYWTLRVAGGELENAAWSYEAPIAQVAQLKGYIAFYTDKVDVQIG
jgi:uncharacterized protein (DUF427 family)